MSEEFLAIEFREEILDHSNRLNDLDLLTANSSW